jgi:cell division protein FtsW
VLAEELGALGALAVLVMLVVLVQRGLLHGRRAELRGDFFAAFLAYGAGLLLAFQVLVSLGVNTGVLPTKGLTLPFLSYGGNSLVVSSALVGLIARVAWENQGSPLPSKASGAAPGPARKPVSPAEVPA